MPIMVSIDDRKKLKTSKNIEKTLVKGHVIGGHPLKGPLSREKPLLCKKK